MGEDRGYALSYRRLWVHPIFRNKQEAAVFAWMKDIAQWQEATIRTKFGPIVLQRGELIIAEREIADDFGLHRNTLRALIQRMADDGMITPIRDRIPHRAGTVIRLTNYDTYQLAGAIQPAAQDRKRTETGTEEGPKEDRSGTKNNEVKELKSLDDDEEIARAREIVKGFLANRERLWPATSRLPANGLTMLADARQFVKAGVTPAFFAEVVTPRMDRMAEGNRSPPNSPGFFRDTISDALARLAESEKPLPIERPANGRAPQAPAEQSSSEAPPGEDRFLKRFGKGLGELPRADGDPVLPAA